MVIRIRIFIFKINNKINNFKIKISNNSNKIKMKNNKTKIILPVVNFQQAKLSNI